MTDNREKIKAAFESITNADRKRLAKALGTSLNCIYQITTGSKSVSPVRAKHIARILDRPNLAKILRPDVF